MTTPSTLFHDAIDRYMWQHTADMLVKQPNQPKSAYYLWQQALGFARNHLVRLEGHPVYCGAIWNAKIDETAKALLTELGVSWEMYAGYLYIEGLRVFWNNSKGRYEQDTYR